MYTDSTLQPIQDDAQYIAPKGTRYPSNWDKSTIPDLHAVTKTTVPTDPTLNVTGFIIDNTYTQVWQTTSKSSADIQTLILSSLAAHRYSIETGGTTISGITIQTDKETQATLGNARQLAKEDNTYTVTWKFGPTTFTILDAKTIIVISNAVAAFVKKCFASEGAIVSNISNYSTPTAAIVAFDTLMAS
jgi:hypothetical protein